MSSLGKTTILIHYFIWKCFALRANFFHGPRLQYSLITLMVNPALIVPLYAMQYGGHYREVFYSTWMLVLWVTGLAWHGTLRQVSYFSVLPRSGGGTVPFLPIHTSQSIVTLANHYTVSLKRLVLWYGGDALWLWWKLHPFPITITKSRYVARIPF